MKRTWEINFFISVVLGMAIGDFVMQAIQNSSIFYGLCTIMATSACVLNFACMIDESADESTDESADESTDDEE